jgi:SAM-dependent methyltransferase
MAPRSKTQLLKEYIRGLLDEVEQKQKKLRVFDFDDTLVKTDAKTYVTHSDGSVSALTPGEYAVYEPRPGDTFDYTQFQQVINPRQIQWTGEVINNIYRVHGPTGFIILTARGTIVPVEEFMKDAGMPGVKVVGLGTSDPNAKAAWIKERFETDNLDELEFFDDSPKNVAAVAGLESKKIATRTRSTNDGNHVIYVCKLTKRYRAGPTSLRSQRRQLDQRS